MFQFFVRANDRGSPSFHEDVSVNIFIMSPSDEAPRFEKKEKVLFLTEHSAPGTNIAKIELISNMTVKLKIVSEGENPQFVISDAGDLRLAKTLDRETKDQHLVVIMAETEASPALTAVTEFMLHILDENDCSPIFESNPYVLILSENVPPGSSIMKVTAKDADAGSNGDVRYTISSDDGEILNTFDVDQHSGWLTTLVPLDKEKRGNFKFQVVATDNGQPRHSSRTTVSISLKDYNDNPYQFRHALYNASVSEDALPGTVLTQVAITDRDVDLNTPYDYHIISGDTLSQFQIRQTGEVFIVKPLDRYESLKWLYLNKVSLIMLLLLYIPVNKSYCCERFLDHR